MPDLIDRRRGTNGSRHLHRRHRAGLRLHQRLPRRGQLDRHRGLDARALAAHGRRVGGVLQLRRLRRLPAARRRHHRQGRSSIRSIVDNTVVAGRADRRDRLEPDHLVVRPPVELVARARSAGSPAPASPRPASASSAGRRSRRPRCSSCSRRCSAWSLGGALLVAVAWIAAAQHAGQGRPLVPPRAAVSRPRCSASATAATTRRRPWASSRCCCIANGLPGATFVACPFWVVLVCHAGDGPGHALGRLAHRADDGHAARPSSSPCGGFCAETGGAIDAVPRHRARACPVSTTHTITGAIVGVGSVNAPERRALGRGAAHRLGVGVHDPVGGADRGGQLLCAARFSSPREDSLESVHVLMSGAAFRGTWPSFQEVP